MRHKVLRIERPNGFGVYSEPHIKGLDLTGADHRPINEHTILYQDDPDFRFGFINQQQLEKWFNNPEELECLRAEGCGIVEYETNEISYIDEFQCVFPIHNAKIIRARKL